jgi:hypothetical protein
MIARQSHLLPRALALAVVVAPTPAAAWNAAGHMTVALVAFEHMNPATRAKAIELVRAHPRFDDHFARPLERALPRGSVEEKYQWLFAYASTWPDVVRSASGRVTRDDVRHYNRVWWHFVNQPVYLNDAERQLLEPTVRVNVLRDPPADRDDRNMNVIQAINNSSRIVGDASADRGLRSIHLCWLAHLAGDSHQPLHSSTLFTARRFPVGDRGGNFLYFSHDYPLHAFWDDQASIEESFEGIRNLALDLAKNGELAAAGAEAAASLDPGVWIDEGHELAKKFVYTPEVLQQISARERHPHLGPLNTSAQYAADAEALAEKQAVVAAHRLAKLLEQLLK